jgi:hypothetical protein
VRRNMAGLMPEFMAPSPLIVRTADRLRASTVLRKAAGESNSTALSGVPEIFRELLSGYSAALAMTRNARPCAGLPIAIA